MRLSTKLLLLGFLVLLINSAYLISFGEPTLFYIGNVLLHIVLGVALIVPFIVYVCRRFDGMSVIGKGGVTSLGIGIISGVYLMFVGATTPNRWLLIVHIVHGDLRHDPICRTSVDFGEKRGDRVFTQGSTNHRDCPPHQPAVPRRGKADSTLSPQPGLPCEKPALSTDQHV